MENVKASFDTNTMDGQIKVFNAMNGASISLKNLESGTIIEASGLLISDSTIDSYGKPQDVKITSIFGIDGNTYAGVSDTVSKAAEQLLDFLAVTGLQEFKVKVIKQHSKAGNEFLSLQLVN